jgi:aminopeptidase N
LKTSAYRTDATRGTTPLRQPLANLSAAKSAYGAIVYSKGPAVLRQAEFYLGEPAFRRAVRDFLKRHAYGAADWSDLVRAFERASKRDLAAWADAWVKRRGLPNVTLRWQQGRLLLSQEDALGEAGLWPQKLVVAAAGEDGQVRTSETRFERRSVRVVGPAAHPAARWLYANAGDFGYGRFLLDDASRAALLAEPRALPDGLLRAQLVEALWESVRDAELAPAAFIDWALALLEDETDDVILAGLLARVDAAFRRYLDDAQRERLAPRLERVLLEAMLGETPQSRRILLFRAYAAHAWSSAATPKARSSSSHTRKPSAATMRAATPLLRSPRCRARKPSAACSSASSATRPWPRAGWKRHSCRSTPPSTRPPRCRYSRARWRRCRN